MWPLFVAACRVLLSLQVLTGHTTLCSYSFQSYIIRYQLRNGGIMLRSQQQWAIKSEATFHPACLLPTDYFLYVPESASLHNYLYINILLYIKRLLRKQNNIANGNAFSRTAAEIDPNDQKTESRQNFGQRHAFQDPHFPACFGPRDHVLSRLHASLALPSLQTAYGFLSISTMAS